MKHLLVSLRNRTDSKLKFPDLRKGDIGVQVGFDLSSPNLTSDLFVMHLAVGDSGLVIGIDPDPTNIQSAQRIIDQKKMNIKLFQNGTWHEPGKLNLVIGQKASWNVIEDLHSGKNELMTGQVIEVQLDTLDNILQKSGIDIDKIKHINITNNGAEYATLKGMKRILSESKDLTVTVVAGRPGPLGQIDGKPDYFTIMDYLKSFGFRTRFWWLNKLIWGGFIHLFLLKRQRIFKNNLMGVVVAKKGKHRYPFYQSFS